MEGLVAAKVAMLAEVPQAVEPEEDVGVMAAVELQFVEQ
jgi:hypothetical protein